MHDFTDTARRIAHEDVEAFVSGDRPIPSHRFHNLRGGVLQRRSLYFTYGTLALVGGAAGGGSKATHVHRETLGSCLHAASLAYH